MSIATGWLVLLIGLILMFAIFEPIIFIIIGVIAALILLIKGIILLAGLITWWGGDWNNYIPTRHRFNMAIHILFIYLSWGFRYPWIENRKLNPEDCDCNFRDFFML